jgi:1A family penicillin-binding protein
MKNVLKNSKKFVSNKKKYFIYITLILFGVFLYFFIFYKLPSPYSLTNYKVVPLATHILDRNGKLLYKIYRDQKRTQIKIKSIPNFIIQATIATEDKDFYKHRGISFVGGIIRALKETILKKNLQGGSTITQQLVKSALLSPERTIRRKIKEIILALWTERIYTKNEILEMYLNQVPYGGSSYGIEEASKTYFSKSAKNLNLSEAALLAGLPQAPSLYSPFLNPKLSKERRNQVLKNMLEEHFITNSQYDASIKTSLNISSPKTTIKAPHFVFYVKNILEKEYGIRTVEEGGLKVWTTLDLRIQEKAEEAVSEEIESIKSYNISNAAALVTRPPTGEILAMVGSVDYFSKPYGAYNVTTALRQPGSSIKPINYAIGLERGLVTAATVFLDTPTCFTPAGQPKKYCPVNYDRNFHGPVSLRTALANSYNIPAVKMLAMNGVENFVASSSAFTITNFKDPSKYGLSLTLGGGEIQMTEFAQAFSTFANSGKPRKLNAILRVEDRNGKILYKFKDLNFVQDIMKPLRNPNIIAIPGKNAVSEDTTFIISHILADNNARSAMFGSNSKLVIPKKTVSVKTGTTDDLKDNWTIGYTSNFLTVVWVGNNDNTPMNPYLTSGITGAAPIWNDIMTYILDKQPNLTPLKPSTVVGRYFCNDTGIIVGSTKNIEGGCPSHFEYVSKKVQAPSNFKVERKTIAVTKDSDKMVANPAEGDSNIDIKEKTVLTDGYSYFCVDCAGDALPTPTPRP